MQIRRRQTRKPKTLLYKSDTFRIIHTWYTFSVDDAGHARVRPFHLNGRSSRQRVWRRCRNQLALHLYWLVETCREAAFKDKLLGTAHVFSCWSRSEAQGPAGATTPTTKCTTECTHTTGCWRTECRAAVCMYLHDLASVLLGLYDRRPLKELHHRRPPLPTERDTRAPVCIIREHA